MNDMFAFEPAAWELLTDSLPYGASLSAIRLLQALEREEEAAVQDALEALLEKHISLELAGLPMGAAGGELEKRIRLEKALVESGGLPQGLEETDPLRIYLEELAATPAQGDIRVLLDSLLAGDDTAGAKILTLQLSRVVEQAKAFAGRGVLMMDLIQEGSLGLWQGILSYTQGDPEAWLGWWVGQYMAHALFLQARQSGVSQHLKDAMEAYQAADRALLDRLGRNASLEEIALEMGVTPEEAEQVEDVLRTARTMDHVRKEPPQESPEDQQAVEDTAYFQSRQRIQELLSTLTEQEAKVLSLRFGLEGGVPETPQSVSAKLGITPQQVLDMETQALAKLRNQT